MPSATILVVDDQFMNRKLVRLVLEDEGFDVRCVASAEEARTALQELDPALILMDVRLPGTDGLTLTRDLRADPRFGRTWIVALSAETAARGRAAALAAGCDAYVSKPIDTLALPELVGDYLSRPREVR